MNVLEARLIEYGMKIRNEYWTGTHKDGSRGKEILDWLVKHTETIASTIVKTNETLYDVVPPDNFIIIDDEMYDIEDYFDYDHIVKINWINGLNYWKTKEAIKKLKEL